MGMVVRTAPRPARGGRQPFTHESCIWLGSRPEPGATRATRRRRPRQAGAVRRSRPARKYQAAAGVSSLATTGPITVCEPTQRKHVFGSSPSGRHDRRQTTKWSRLCPCRALGRQRSTTETPWRPWAPQWLCASSMLEAGRRCQTRGDREGPFDALRSRQSCVAKGAGRSAGR